MTQGSTLAWAGVFFMVIAGVMPTPARADELRIAVRANKGSDETMMRWQKTADYLNQALPAHHFSIVPFENNSALNQAISSGDYAFCLTNPASAVELKIRYGNEPLATLFNKRLGNGYAYFGSVIFTRADRQDITGFHDLKGKTYMGVDELGFGGWRLAWYELQKAGIDPYTDFKTLRFAGGNQKSVVRAVLSGAVDAGSVRTDTLEDMDADGEISLQSIKVLGAKRAAGFPFLLSTPLYPEWLFSASKETPTETRRAVRQALLAIDKNDPAAIAGRYVGWIQPLDYTPIETLLRDLKVGPYRVTQASLLTAFLKQYTYPLIATLIVLMVLIAAFLYVTRLNRRITQTQAHLKSEIVSRERAEQALTSLAQQSLEFAKEEQFFKLCLTELTKLFKTKYAFIGLYVNAEKDRIKTYVNLVGGQFLDNYEYALAHSPCRDVLTRKLELITHHARQRYPEYAPLQQMGIESYFGTPLTTADGEIIGLVALMDDQPMHPLTDRRSVLHIFANRIALEVQRKREEQALQGMAEQLSYQASHDALTNLCNRREFEVQLTRAWSSAKNQHRQHAFCFLDLDQFKVVNDTHGHAAGDELLKQVSATLSSLVRGSDTLARLGGDEFGVLLLDCPMDRAQALAEALLEAVKAYRFCINGQVSQVGVSIGIAPINAESKDVQTLFQAADSACYIAKNLGRNRICVSDREPGSPK